MRNKDMRRNIKSIKYLQSRADDIDRSHDHIRDDIQSVKEKLKTLGDVDESAPNYLANKQAHLREMNKKTELTPVNSETIYNEAETAFPGQIALSDILSQNDLAIVDERVAAHIRDFDSRYSLDKWDYAIAGGCGLVAAMLDLLCVKAPAKPTARWSKRVDGVFNRWVQDAFNATLPPELSRELARVHSIHGADACTVAQLMGAPPGTVSPMNHRLRSLAHDPILGFLFGVLDMLDGKCTTISNGRIQRFGTVADPVDGSLFPLLGRMFGHLLSDVNAPSANGNRGMGLPAPFMGVLRMFDGIPIGDSDLGKQVEYMYARGYDFRHFVVTSIPMLIMEVMMRVFYAIKHVKSTGTPLGETLIGTMPGMMNPKFRIMLAIGYGTAAGVNAGKVYISKNILNLNYAAWLGLVWNGFYAVKWVLMERHLKLWEEFERQEIEELERIVESIEGLVERAESLPV